MPNFVWRTTATDGTFQTGQTNLFEFDTGNVNPQVRQVCEILCPNVTQLGTYATVANNSYNSNGTIPYYRTDNGAWIQQEYSSNKFLKVDSTKDCWVVITPNPNSYITKVYICKDAAEKALIPDYTNIPAIEYRIVSAITPTNYNNWRKWNDTRPGTTNDGIMLCPVYITLSDNSVVWIEAKVKEGKIYFWSYSCEYGKATSDVDQGSLPVVSPFLKKGNVIVYDLDERVTILETKVAELERFVKVNTDDIDAIKRKIVDIGAAGSLYFVAR